MWATAGIVGAGAVGGVTYAAVATPAAASSSVTADGLLASVAGPAGGAGHGKAGRLGGRALLNRLEHGELTLKAKNGDRTVDLQRGTVQSVGAGTIAVKSADGFPGSYTVTSATKVRGKGGPAGISSVHPGDTVFVIASGGTALRIVDRG